MMKPITCRAILLVIYALFPFSFLLSQDCTVDNESLKGTYTGDCKNGKANGKGKAVGTDTYDGDFKSGVPDGQGTYVWSNGNRYTGKFVKGLKEGKGAMVWKRNNATDSIVEGYWKKDNYTGKFEKPYAIIYKSKSVTDVDVELKKNGFRQISFFISNTSGGGATLGGSDAPKMSIDDIQLTKGTYGRTMTNSDHAKKMEYILYDVTYPIHMKLTFESEQLELEFNEEGSYIVNIKINQ